MALIMKDNPLSTVAVHLDGVQTAGRQRPNVDDVYLRRQNIIKNKNSPTYEKLLRSNRSKSLRSRNYGC